MDSPELTSHNLAVVSEDPVTTNDESAENTQSQTQRVWPVRVVASERSLRFQSFTVLSDDAVAKYLEA